MCVTLLYSCQSYGGVLKQTLLALYSVERDRMLTLSFYQGSQMYPSLYFYSFLSLCFMCGVGTDPRQLNMLDKCSPIKQLFYSFVITQSFLFRKCKCQGEMCHLRKSLLILQPILQFCNPYCDFTSIDPVRSVSHDETLILLCLSGQYQPLLYPQNKIQSVGLNLNDICILFNTLNECYIKSDTGMFPDIL